MALRPVEIDGSVMEGGGSIVRLSSALSVMTGRPVRIINIRAGRPQPGLRTQHLRGLELISGLCGGRLDGAKLGSKDVTLHPGRMTAENFELAIETAGSVGLVVQSLLMASLKSRKMLTVSIHGGATFGKHAPPLHYIQFVLLPLLRRMGYRAEINIIRHGFYPVGGAEVRVMVEPCGSLGSLALESRGEVESVDIVSVASMGLKKPRVAERQARHAEAMLRKREYRLNVKVRYSDAPCAGSGMVLVARTSGGCVIGADGLGEMGKSAEAVAEEAVGKLLAAIDSGATVDEHMSDQLLPYFALSGKRCSLTVPALTPHAATNIHVLEKFLPVTFSVGNVPAGVRIEC